MHEGLLGLPIQERSTWISPAELWKWLSKPELPSPPTPALVLEEFCRLRRFVSGSAGISCTDDDGNQLVIESLHFSQVATPQVEASVTLYTPKAAQQLHYDLVSFALLEPATVRVTWCQGNREHGRMERSGEPYNNFFYLDNSENTGHIKWPISVTQAFNYLQATTAELGISPT